MFAAVAIKEDQVILTAVSERPVTEMPLQGGFDRTEFCAILSGFTDAQEFTASLAIVDGELVSASCELAVLTQSEIQLLDWRDKCQVSSYQIKAALLNAGLLDAAKTAVSSLGGVYELYWDEETTWKRTSPEPKMIGNTLGLTADELDALFLAAQTN